MVAMAGCGASSRPASKRADQSFVALVHQNAPDIGTYRSDPQILELGHAVCGDLASGASLLQVADRIATVDASNPLPSVDLGSVMSAAGNVLCPKYASLFGSSGPG
jgi:hypothetical protein